VSVHGKLKPKTYQLYESLCRVWLVPYFGHREASTITAADIEALQAHMRATPRAKGGSAPLSPKTINEALGCLSSMFNTAKRWKYLRENPCDQVERMSVPPVDFAFYDAEQTARWLATCQELEPDWYALFFVAFRTGMREGELFALEVPDLDLQREFVRVQRTYGPAAARDEETGLAVRAYFEHSAKNNRIRTIGLTAGTLGVLRVHVRRRRAGLVWSTRTRPDGDPHLTRSIVEAPFSRVTAAAKLPPIGLHGMRHSFASQLAMADVPLAKIQQLLGHASIKMTERYAHLAPGHASSAVNVLDTLVGTAPASGPNNAGRTPGSVVGVTGFEPVPAVLDFDPSKRRKRA
jgi:integrase